MSDTPTDITNDADAPADLPGGHDTRSQTADRFELGEALGKPGCAICRLAAIATDRYLEDWTYETFTDFGDRETLIRVGDFCTTHTWALARKRAAFQLAVAYRDILTTRLRSQPREGAVPGGAAANGRGSWLRRLLGQVGADAQQAGDMVEANAAARWKTCPACRARTLRERLALSAFAQAAADPDFQRAFAASDGLCLLHYTGAREAVDATQSKDVVAALDGAEHDCLRRTLSQLDELIRKHDYRFGDEPQDDEMRSWLLAAELVAGREGLW